MTLQLVLGGWLVVLGVSIVSVSGPVAHAIRKRRGLERDAGGRMLSRWSIALVGVFAFAVGAASLIANVYPKEAAVVIGVAIGCCAAIVLTLAVRLKSGS